MNTKFITLASAFVLSVAAQSVSARPDRDNCLATADLRANGTPDVIRVTNQNEHESMQVLFRIINTSGRQLGHDYSVPLAANASFRTTVGGVYTNTGASTPNSILLVFNPSHLIQVVQSEPFADVLPDGVPDSWLQSFQATYKNAQTGQVQPLLFTCEPLD